MCARIPPITASFSSLRSSLLQPSKSVAFSKVKQNFVSYKLNVRLALKHSQFIFKVSNISYNEEEAWKITKVLLTRPKIRYTSRSLCEKKKCTVI
jgi:hypothetical protein